MFVVNPDNLPEGKAQICSINDMEINAEENLIYFTGVTAEEQLSGYIHPMTGVIDMNLGLQWCYSYEMQGNRYSGVDLEFGDHESSLFVLMNSSDYPFSIMELDLRGNVLQQPESYTFTGKTCGSASEFLGASRGHIMHYTETNGLKVTGNVFIQNEHDISQRLFSYDIPAASNLRAGNSRFGTYSCDPIPDGNQPAVTSWWAPENSLYSNQNLSIIGYCNYNALQEGYVYVNTAGFNFADSNCYYEGKVSIKDLTTHPIDQPSYITQCEKTAFSLTVNDWMYDEIENCSTGLGKSSIIEDDVDKLFWNFASIDETGIHGYINSEEEAQYQINVFDLTGRKVCSETYNVEGQKYVHLKFATYNQLYLINVSNGTQSETIKVSGVK